MGKDELMYVLESVETKLLVEALWNKINRLEILEADMLGLLRK
jgi:hypothetical protein